MDRSNSGDVLATVVQMSPFPAFLRDRSGRYLWVNAAYAALHGIANPKDMVGKRIADLNPTAVAEDKAAADRAARRSGHPLPHALQVEWDGRRFLLPGHVFGVTLPDGDVAAGGMYSDTAGARAHPVDARARVLSSPWKQAPVALAVVSADGVLLDTNRRWSALLGFSDDTRNAEPLARYVRHPNPSEVVGLLHEHGRTGEPVDAFMWHASGDLLPVELRVERAEKERLIVCALVSGPLTPAPHVLTGRQRTLLERLATGRDNAQLAMDMGLSRQGLDYHIRQLRDEMAAASRAEIVARAYFHGVLDIRSWPPKVRARHLQ
ncbi:helix-turn-helix transcriptional regulator [Lentzea aerocolonigenes]|uniref:helix-turn-helix transcriptional regulator n=1 Tax=Lentzea aerocolonigenes TaxID=68170 RepID=UPI00069607C2|nr:PAS domain-containing protein [Lentzea aerocolonigenes]